MVVGRRRGAGQPEIAAPETKRMIVAPVAGSAINDTVSAPLDEE